jgi:hypothetical protein
MSQIDLEANDVTENTKKGALYAISAVLAIVSFYVVAYINGWVVAGIEGTDIDGPDLLKLSQRIDLLLWIIIFLFSASIGNINRSFWLIGTFVEVCAFINITTYILISIF